MYSAYIEYPFSEQGDSPWYQVFSDLESAQEYVESELRSLRPPCYGVVMGEHPLNDEYIYTIEIDDTIRRQTFQEFISLYIEEPVVDGWRREGF